MPIIMHNTSRSVGDSYIPPTPRSTAPHPHADYLSQFPPMKRAKIQAAMDRYMRLDGVAMSRWEAARRLLGQGGLRHDPVKARLYHGADGCFYDVSALT